MSEQGIVGRADLQKKDKGELQAIVAALGGKSTSRDRKADLIDKVLELSGVLPPAEASTAASPDEPAASQPVKESALPFDSGSDAAPTPAAAPASVETASVAAPSGGPREDAAAQSSARAEAPSSATTSARQPSPTKTQQRGEQKADGNKPDQGPKRGRNRRGRAGEPPAEWETDLSDVPAKSADKVDRKKNDGNKGSKNDGNKNHNDGAKAQGDRKKNDGNQSGGQSNDNSGGNQNNGGQKGNQNGAQNGGQNAGNQGGSNQNGDDDSDGGNRRRRRRGRNRDREDEVANLEPVAVSGFMELRDDGYGFLRVSGWMPSKDDVYVPVRMVRQCGLRKGDHIVGTARPANRNEKNPAMENIESINGLTPVDARDRPLFDDLTPLFPTERLRLEQDSEPGQLAARIVDLVAPIGKGQRGLIMAPPRSGKTSVIKDLARSIEKNNPEVHLVVLLIDERPEEVTEMARGLDHAEVVASMFDRPPEEHCALAELTIERAKRMVEAGEDIVILVDGITRLARAYNASAQTSGRLTAGVLDAAAIYPAKRFFGAARNLDEGGSLTIVATASIETGSRTDEVIFEEFAGTSNMELWLDRALAERGVFPAIDAAASSTQRAELLVEDAEYTQVQKLRTVLSGLKDSDGSARPGIDLLVERLGASATNADFLGQVTTM